MKCIIFYQRAYKRDHFIVSRFKQKDYSKIKNLKSLVLVFQYKTKINTKEITNTNDLKNQNS